MRLALVLFAFAVPALVLADEKGPANAPKRYGIAADLKSYPQDSPRTTLASVAKAIEEKKIDYLLAHLADPEWVDERVRAYGGDFAFLVKEATGKLVDNPAPLKHFQKFQKDGTWETSEDAASVHHKDVLDRWARFRKLEGRWFLENRYKPDPGAK